MRADRRSLATALILSAVFGVVAEWIGAHGPTSGAIRSLSAPWLVVPFVVGALQSSPRRAVIVGLACTYAAIAGYGMMTLSIGGHHLALAEPGPWFYIERYTLLGGLVTGPLFGWFGWQWRSRRAVVGALITAAAFCLEPAARRLAEKPIHFANVALAEIVVGLAFAAAVLIRKARRPI